MTLPTTIDPLSTNLAELTAWAAATFGDSPAIRDGDVDVAYTELGELTTRAAAALIASGVEPGDVVAVWAPNCWQWVVAALGTARAGAQLLPVNTRFKGKEAAYVLRTASAKLCFVVDGFLDTDYSGSLADHDLPSLTEILDLRSDLDDMTVRQGDPYLIVNPYFHAFGFNGGIVVCLLFGALNLPLARYETGEVLATIEREQVTIFPGPPALYLGLLNHPALGDHDVSSLRGCVTGAASIPVELVVAMRERLGFESIVTAYGMTETSGLVTHTRRGDPAEVISATSGRVIDGVEVRIVDDDGIEVEQGQPGELLVRGYQVTPGYLVGDEGVVGATDDDGWLHTGDVVVMDEAGYIDITDRKKDVFIVGGFNAYPAEIERMISEHPDVAMVAVVGVPDDRLGEVVGAAFVVPTVGATPTAEALISWCRQTMANYKVPRHIWFVDELPLTASNKVQKPALRLRAAELTTEAGR